MAWKAVLFDMDGVLIDSEEYMAKTGVRALKKYGIDAKESDGAASLGLAPSECIVVEDAPSGIRAAHAAGIEAIGLATSFPADYLRQQAQPDYLLPDLKSILMLL